MSISVSHLSYTYRSRTQVALSDVSVTFQPGQIALVAGTSGCGKTTLIRCINGLIPHSYANGILKGRITLFGKDITTTPLAQASQLVGTVLQDPEQQIVASDVMAEIAFGLENMGLPRDEIWRRVSEVASFLHITPLLERETFALSGGEKQKVALAGVLAMQPRTLLLDEPLASLDPASGHETLLLLRELAAQGIAVVVVEHRVEDILTIQPEQCVYMTDGRIAYDGNSAGFIQSVDWNEVKLPARAVLQRIRVSHKERRVQPTFVRTRSYASQPEPLLEFEHVHFRYKDGPDVLTDISFTVNAGDRIAVMGANGAGKSTLVKHAVGLNKPTRGDVRVHGVSTYRMSVAQAAHTVGYVFQSPSHMLFAPTIREELSFGPRNLGFVAADINRHISSALKTVRMSGFEETSPLALSFGQQKRISIASILTMQPAVLVMDEPSAGQDYVNYTHFMDSIIDVEGNYAVSQALIYITHDLDLAIVYANRIVLLDEGRLIADGAPQTVLCDRALLERCRLRATSLLELNLELLAQTSCLYPVQRLAEHI